MPPLASDKIRLWFRVTVLLMPVDKLESLLLICSNKNTVYDLSKHYMIVSSKAVNRPTRVVRSKMLASRSWHYRSHFHLHYTQLYSLYSSNISSHSLSSAGV